MKELLCVVILKFIEIYFHCSVAFKETPVQMQHKAIDQLMTKLYDYDENAVPLWHGHPVNVSLQIFIEDMVPTADYSMHYSMSMFLRQFWRDYRLAHEELKKEEDNSMHHNGSEMVQISDEFVDKIWTPDLFFLYGKTGKRQDLVKPNVLLRLGKDGTILFSQRIQVVSFCQMDLRNYPFDKQQCDFPLSSYAYNNKFIQLYWNKALGEPISPPKNKYMGGYTFDRLEYQKQEKDLDSTGVYSVLNVRFFFKRNFVIYILSMYVPSMMIVILSWIGFWIDYRSIPARCALGITSVLTMATQANNIRTSVPSTSYTKSIDLYVILCFFYVFCAFIEYAFVGVTDLLWRKHEKREKSNKLNYSFTNNVFEDIKEEEDEAKHGKRSGNYRKRNALTMTPDTSALEQTYKAALKRRSRNSIKAKVANKLIKEQSRNNEVHYVDRVSRYVFPSTYLLCNVIYFVYCLMFAQ